MLGRVAVSQRHAHLLPAVKPAGRRTQLHASVPLQSEISPAVICRRVAHVKPGAVGGVEHAIIICEEGLDVGKAVEDSDSVVLRLSSADEVQLSPRPPCV